MNWLLQRLFYTKGKPKGDFTCGYLTNGQGYNSFCLEDRYYEVKIPGQTRIPAGRYELKLREQNTPLTIKHRATYKTPWFLANPNWYHIEITGIKGFSGVYVHSGNDDSHTLGCILPAYTFDLTRDDKETSNSLLAVDAFYSLTYPLLNKGVRCFIDIRDEIKF